MKELGVEHQLSTTYLPESQGALERIHQTLKSLLRTYCTETGKGWVEVNNAVILSSVYPPELDGHLSKDAISSCVYVHGFWHGKCTSNIPAVDVEDRDTVTEGQNISLTCNTSCALNLTANSHTFIWYKNKTRLGPEHSSNKLNLIAVSSADTDRYSCALKDLETFASEERLITVNHSYVWNKRTGILMLYCLLILVILLFMHAALWMKMTM
ncbi:uncharacterized protein LOC127632438 [Xyrauchen texanus]|uniref:uncharacterized protein LOC127632438 n=1 Tax=Xyrauchen texanus TaxID=154827 RepID=UPI00224228FD|nr:uncharacterized protein LOC127632438 [Xyrauchen texanus]